MTLRSSLAAAAVASFAVLASAGMASQPSGQPAWPIRILPIPTPAGPDSAQPQLTVSPRGVLVSWIERSGTQAALKFAERSGDDWTAPRTAATGENWFVNWADVPSVVRLDDGTLVAHWLQKSGAGTYAYDVRLASSSKDGQTWSPSSTPHHDGTHTEHGFASLFQMPGAGLGLVWLDGRAMKGGHEGNGDMALRFGAFRGAKQTAETLLDARVCECCPTAVAVTSDGPIVAYRDRSDGEIRDISIARLENGKWTAPATVYRDDWKINACPVNGPSLSARGRDVAIAWFTAVGDQPRSYAAFSSDAGRAFGSPIRLDDDGSLGRVDIELLPDGSAAAAYIEFADQKAQLRVRRVSRDGKASAPVTIAGIAGNRTSGYPRMAYHGGELVFAWTERQGAPLVRTAAARVPDASRGSK